MDVKELRIGNYVEAFGKVIIVTSDFISWLYYGNKNNLTPDAKYLKLTEEWLLKFGFKKFRKNKFRIKITAFAILEIEIERDDKLKCFIVKSDFSRDDRIVFRIIKHVHQLQNLYFSLTGEELIIKE